jgi:hypothetical protein
VTVKGLSPSQGQVLIVTAADEKLTAPVLVAAQGRGKVPAKVAGTEGAGVLGAGAWVVSGATTLILAMPSLGGVAPRSAWVDVMTLGAKDPAITSANPEAQEWFDRAQQEMAKARYDVAAETFKKGFKLDPQNANAHFHECLNDLARGDTANGRVSCNTFAIFAPANDRNRPIAETVREQLTKLSARVPGR